METLLTHIVTVTACKLLLAALLGGAVGMEREWRGKAAGLRTHILIAIGAALFTTTSMQLAPAGDPTRIAAQVVTGVGFIGAGVIIRHDGSVVGLTTAASIFVVAAIGLTVGAGLWWPAVVATVIMLTTLSALTPLENALRRRHQALASSDSAGDVSRADSSAAGGSRKPSGEHRG